MIGLSLNRHHSGIVIRQKWNVKVGKAHAGAQRVGHYRHPRGSGSKVMRLTVRSHALILVTSLFPMPNTIDNEDKMPGKYQRLILSFKV